MTGDVIKTLDRTEINSGSYTFKYNEMSFDQTITVTFADYEYYYVTVSGQNVTNTKANPDKLKVADSAADVTGEDSTRISWTPNTGATFKEIKVTKADGTVLQTVTTAPAGNSYDLTGLSGTANETIKVEVIYDPPAPPAPTTYTVNVTSAFANVTNGSATVNEGTNHTVTFKPLDGYELDTFTVNGADAKAALSGNATTGFSYTVTGAAAGSTVNVNIVCKKTEDPEVEETYTVSTSHTGSGTVTDGGTFKEADSPNSKTINWTPATGWYVDAVTITEGTAAPVTYTKAANNLPADYSFEPFTADTASAKYHKDVSINVKFEQYKPYNVLVSTTGSGATTGAGVINYNDADAEMHFVTWKADPDWVVNKVTVMKNGTTVSVDPFNGTPADASYTGGTVDGHYVVKYSELTDDVQVNVEFKRIGSAAEGFAVTTASIGNGTVTPGDSFAQNDSPNSKLIEWSADTGWYVDSVTITEGNAAPVTYTKAAGNLRVNYNFDPYNSASPSYNKNVDISVVFAKEKVFKITAVIDEGGSFSTPVTAELKASGDTYTPTWTIDTANNYAFDGATVNNTQALAPTATDSSYLFDYDTLVANNSPENIVFKVNVKSVNGGSTPEPGNQYLVSTRITPNAAGSISNSALVAEGATTPSTGLSTTAIR